MAKHKEAILMYGCYVEVVFHFVAKAILFLCFFGFDIYPYIPFHFLKCFLLFFMNNNKINVKSDKLSEIK